MEGNVEIRDESSLDKLDKMQEEYIGLENEYEEAKRILEEKKIELADLEDEKEPGE